jgi:hypothetical protein
MGEAQERGLPINRLNVPQTNTEIHNNMKLEIKHLAPYLPYGVRFIGKYKDWEYENHPMILCPIDLTANKFEYIKPILSPLSDLTKEIEYNGEKFVPIEWLFIYLVDESDVVEFDFTKGITPIFQVDDGWNHCISFKNDYGRDLCFSFDSNSNSFMLGLGWENEFGVEWCMISNQYEMFQKLFEWHFDLFRLIENNLAININKI